MSVSISTVGYIQVSDTTTGLVSLKKLFASLLTTGTVFAEGQSVSIGTSPVVVTSGITPIQFLYVKNLHATNNLTVTWTPTGGSAATVIVLAPGSAILFTEAAVVATGGVGTLTLTGSGAATLCEYLIGG